MIEYQLFEAGFCTHCKRMTLKKGALKNEEYPALCALIKHPDKGYILFDTGYSHHFYNLTRRFPFSLYRYLTPVYVQKTLKEQLLASQVYPDEISYIVISHFHADHIGGLADFPNARFICHPQALKGIENKNGLKALLRGFLPGLLPADFYQRVDLVQLPIPLDLHLNPFTMGYDLFDDGLLYAIELPGHAQGQIGLYFKAAQDVFLVADSCWHQETYKELRYPSQLTYLIHHDKQAYLDTIHKLHQLYLNNPGVDIIPSHSQHLRSRIKD